MNKKMHIPLYMVSKNLSICLLQTLIPIISGLAQQKGLNFFRTSMPKRKVSNFLSKNRLVGLGPRAMIATFKVFCAPGYELVSLALYKFSYLTPVFLILNAVTQVIAWLRRT